MGILNLNTPRTAQSYGMNSFNQKGQKLTVQKKSTVADWFVGLGVFGLGVLVAILGLVGIAFITLLPVTLTIGVFTVFIKMIGYFLAKAFVFQNLSWSFSFYLACVLYLVQCFIDFLVKPNAK